MSEIVNIADHTVAARILLSAVSDYVKDEEFTKMFAANGPIADVKLTINGVEVPVVATLTEIWKRESELLDQLARQKALQMVTAAGLDPLREVLEAAERNIREKLGIWEER